MRVAGVQAAMGNNAGAIQTLRKALALKADLAEAKVAIGELEIREKRPEAALVLARDVQKQLPKSPAGFILEGDSLFADKKFPAAVKAYEAAQALGKSFSTEARLHGALVAAGRQDEGLRRLQAWVKAAPQDASAKLFLADAALKQANYRVAAEQYEPLLAAQPTNLVVLNNLAWTYQQLKDPRAKDLAERAFKIKPDNAAVADTLGWMLVEQGDVRRGIEILEKAVAAAPEAQEIRYHLALGWLKAGDKVKARKELEQVLASERKFPQHAQAVELLGKLR
jgi:putative PEP-CTERM system TPR-repeat lipoprotein